MNARRFAFEVFDHVVHVLWQTCAAVGLFIVLGIPAGSTPPGRLGLPIFLGLAIGVLTSPILVRWLRPKLERRFPWAFRDGPVPETQRD